MSENSGVLSAQPALSNGQKLDDYCGYAPVLLVKDPSLLIDIENMPMSYFGGKEHPEINRALDDLNSSAVLVRPDRYIFGVARNNSQIADLVNSYLRLTLLEK